MQAAEDFLVHLFEDTNLCALHAKRVTISELLLHFLFWIKTACNSTGSHKGALRRQSHAQGSPETLVFACGDQETN